MAASRVGDIPTATKLRSLLGVHPLSDKEKRDSSKSDLEAIKERNRSFEKECKAFLADYKSNRGVAASHFVNWRDKSHRKELDRMAKRFASDNGAGEEFWSGDGPMRCLLRWRTSPKM